jgi:purine-binding chemotaxis protein CheW
VVETQNESAARTKLLATFFVREAMCALDASSVQEVIRVGAITPVRHAAPEVTGVMNLRGRIVTMLDLGMILGAGKTALSRESRVFILEDRNEFLGVLVDRVGEVIEVEGSSGESLPLNVPPSQARFFEGVCRAGGQVIAVLNSGEVLSENRQ